ncbi:uncharacterized protein LY89DRAFT_717068 [Mollisia scopiformis]|uniref:Uncharacterized protein n=1 Tax=Mollisia scopiformis TaxID=149040 RepID=A0A194XHA9_MOLSC|nr:uncharacterized protein LY89DRAFT_717068 [Mollisia scopiformis]KUJ19595.1 hypothetical protein LY89DRAFT_717068 [Mollisia scopiformis]
MKTALVLVASTLAGKTLAGAGNQSPSCTDISFPVTVTAANAIIPITTPITFQQVSGTYNIAARYCEPQNFVESRENTLQVLVHGITYTRNYWSGDGTLETSYDGAMYSWIDFASKQGYPTLSIDRLGNGLSDHPDPVNVLQSPLQVEVSHQIITIARNGNLPISKSRKFDKIVYAGHSYGSVLGNGLTVKYPNDADATILTGLTSKYNFGFIESVFVPAVVPASTVNPKKWSTLNSGYLAIDNKTAFELGFYYPGYFDQGLVDLDWENSGTVGEGELESALVFGPEVATGYVNPILDITGQHDSLMCTNPDPITARTPTGLWQTYNCGNGDNSSLAETKSLYPNADYEYYAPLASGHCLNFHYDAQLTFDYAHNWLNWNGF